MSLLSSLKSHYYQRDELAFHAKHFPLLVPHRVASFLFIAAVAGLGLSDVTGFLSHDTVFQYSSFLMLFYSLAVRTTLKNFLLFLSAALTYLFAVAILSLGLNLEILDSNSLNLVMAAFFGAAFHWTRLGLTRRTYNADLAVAESSLKLNELTRDSQILIDHILEGMYLYQVNDKDELGIDSFHTPLKYPGSDTEEKNPSRALEAFWKTCSLTPDRIAHMHGILRQAIGENILQWHIHSKDLPEEFRLALDHGTRVVTAKWEAIRSDKGMVKKVLLLLKDVTELRLLREDSRARSDDAKRLMELIGNSPKKIGEFFNLAAAMILEGKRSAVLTPENTKLNFRNINTLKAMASSFQLTELTECLNQLEATIQQQTLSAVSLSLQHLPAYQACETSLRNYKNLFLKIYSRPIFGNQVTTDPKVVLELTNQIETALVRSDIQATLKGLNEIRTIFAYTLDKIVIDEITLLRKLADDLNKPHPNLYINELDIQLTDAGKSTLQKVFVQLFRNSIDHGIESDAERKAKSKAPRGQISIHTAKQQESYRITYKDDGQGLALPKILKKAIDLRLAEANRNYSAQEIAELIFQPGLSTALQQTLISGRGLGMDSIRSCLAQEGGDISIELDETCEGPFQTFRLIIDIPLKRANQKLERLERTG